jgi:hypothetical protein
MFAAALDALRPAAATAATGAASIDALDAIDAAIPATALDAVDASIPAAAIHAVAAVAAAAVTRIPAAAIAVTAAAPVVTRARPGRVHAQRALRSDVEGRAQKVCPLHDAIATFAAALDSNQLPASKLRRDLGRDAEACRPHAHRLRLGVSNVPFD